MKMQIELIVSIAVCLFLGCSNAGDKKDKKGEKKKKGAVEETIDYVTGKTPIAAGQKAKAKLIETSIRNAVNSYEVMEGKKPDSLVELADAGYLSRQYLKDEWGRSLITERRNNKLIVRSVGPDKKPNTPDDWVKEF